MESGIWNLQGKLLGKSKRHNPILRSRENKSRRRNQLNSFLSIEFFGCLKLSNEGMRGLRAERSDPDNLSNSLPLHSIKLWCERKLKLFPEDLLKGPASHREYLIPDCFSGLPVSGAVVGRDQD